MEVATKMIVTEMRNSRNYLSIFEDRHWINWCAISNFYFILFYFFNIFVELEETIEVYGKVNDCGGPFLRFGLDAHAVLQPYDSEIGESRLA